MRNVNPDDLDQLAKLFDGKGGVGDKLTEAFSRASTLSVTDKLATLKPMRTWVTETPPDMRKRATAAREEQLLERGDRETYSDWLQRVEAYYLAKVPGLDRIGQENIDAFLGYVGDITGLLSTAGKTAFIASGAATVFFRNSWYSGALRQLLTKTASGQRPASAFVQLLAMGLNKLPKGIPASLSAPGSWLPSRLGALFGNSSLYQDISRIPFTTTRRNALLGEAYDFARGLPGVRSEAATKAINFFVGNDKLAAQFGGKALPWGGGETAIAAGLDLKRAGNANLWRIYKAAHFGQEASNITGVGEAAAPWLTGLKTVSRAGGFLRVAGVGASAVSTGVSFANVVAQGNPIEAYKKKGAGYVADVAEVGFNASMTAAMIAPNPVTIGLAVGTGLVYGGAKVVEHWDDIKDGAGKAANWVGDKASKASHEIASGAKSVAKHLNPSNWF
ncbi:PE-PGRS family protein [Streptomyces sp. NPDC006530]|uniref:PE-PGRS family protein n=1 Tax=Streptomyces sp. NPDC006530 TaxID=3364750 RepID=UPI0036B55F77